MSTERVDLLAHPTPLLPLFQIDMSDLSMEELECSIQLLREAARAQLRWRNTKTIIARIPSEVLLDIFLRVVRTFWWSVRPPNMHEMTSGLYRVGCHRLG